MSIIYTATYSPDDDKLRLYASQNLDSETYARVKAQKFTWAPKQELFVAYWSPCREDLLTELAGEIEDEDKSLVERASERAERFEDYSEAREADHHRQLEHVQSIAGGIPFGQPILVGHHSEKRARKDAEKIQNGMQRAVKLWKQADYWKDRARGAVATAKYKERPDVRHRRIKGLESDIRKLEARYTPKEPIHIIEQGNPPEPHVWCAPAGGRGGDWVPVSRLESIKIGYARWIEHYRNRIAYERGMLAEQGGLVAQQYDLQPGGMVLIGGGLRGDEWLTIKKLNKGIDGEVVSVSLGVRDWRKVSGIEAIKGYRPPTEESTAAVKKATKLPPILNYETAGCAMMTQAQWNKLDKGYKSTKVFSDGCEPHRVRYGIVGPLRVSGALGLSGKPGHESALVFITDAKVKEPTSSVIGEAEPVTLPTEPVIPSPEKIERRLDAQAERQERWAYEEKLTQASKAGVAVAVSPDLFPTPRELANRMASMLDLEDDHLVLEPSCGTGRLLEAMETVTRKHTVIGVDISQKLIDASPYKLDQRYVFMQGDFLEVAETLRPEFDRVIMNPPFTGGADIKHIMRAFMLLERGGKLVAICANGPRQQRELMPLCDHWEALPTGTFKESGTNVNTALLVMRR